MRRFFLKMTAVLGIYVYYSVFVWFLSVLFNSEFLENISSLFLLILSVITTFFIFRYSKKSSKKNIAQETSKESFTKTTNINNVEAASSSSSSIPLDDFVRFNLAGVHVSGRKNYILNNCFEGDAVVVYHDKRNTFSDKAVAVKHGNKIIGYVPELGIPEVFPFLEKQTYADISLISEASSFLTVVIQMDYKT